MRREPAPVTNEELIIRIRGGDESLIPALWGNVSRLVRYLAAKYYKRHEEQCNLAGIGIDDLTQEAYFGFLEALSSYEVDCGYLFSTHLNYPCQKCFATCAKISSVRGRKDPLNRGAVSIDQPVPETDDALIGDLLPDPSAEAAFQVIESEDFVAEVRLAVAALPDRERVITQKYALDGRSFTECSSEPGISERNLRARYNDAKRKLRAMPRVRRLYFDYYGAGLKGTGINSFKNSSFTSSTERAALKAIEYQEQLEGPGHDIYR